MIDRATGRSRGFGFVTFADQHGFDACRTTNPQVIDGRSVDLKPAVAQGAMPQPF